MKNNDEQAPGAGEDLKAPLPPRNRRSVSEDVERTLAEADALIEHSKLLEKQARNSRRPTPEADPFDGIGGLRKKSEERS